jgi:hypothetical protein
MNVRMDVTYELALESQARIREQARSQWAASVQRSSSKGRADGLGPAAQRLARAELRGSWAREGRAS